MILYLAPKGMAAKVDEVKALTERLEAGVSDLMNSDNYKAWLSTVSRFHRYSLNNQLLIFCQKPDATQVAGYKTWEKMKRQVRKGEKSIRILAPCPFKKVVKDEDTGEEKVVMIPRYKVVGVFDISQTDGDELPTIYKGPVTSDVDGYEALKDLLINICPVEVSFVEDLDGAYGCYNVRTNKIWLVKGLSEAQTIKTLLHEMAHQMLHAGKCEKDRETKEVEAESVAYTVCQYLGIETKDYSFSYIAGWSAGKDVKVLKDSLDTIRKAAANIIDRVDAGMKKVEAA